MGDKIVRKLSKTPLCGVYQIENTINNKKYIGQSIDIERRWNQHRYGKGSIILRNAINKHGINNFEFTILESIPIGNRDKMIDELTLIEEKWLSKEKPFLRENGYNINKSAKVNIPIERPEGYGEMISKIKIDNNHCGKATVQYDLEGNLIKVWKSAAQIERVLGFKAENISACCLRKNKSSKGFIWRFKWDLVSKYDIINLKIKKGASKTIEQKTLDGKVIRVFDSLTAASNFTNIHYTYISKVCTKKQKTAGGFKWSYHE
jgi:group I intron endonuclease